MLRESVTKKERIKILNQYTVDDSLPFILNIFLAQLFGVVGHLVVCAYAVPW